MNKWLNFLKDEVEEVVRSKQIYRNLKNITLLRKFSVSAVLKKIDNNWLEGKSNEFFIGRIGYPWVWVGPLINPFNLKTLPENLVGKEIEEIIDIRSKLVRGKIKTRVDRIDKQVEQLQEIGLHKESEIDSELKNLAKKIWVDDVVQPYGISALIKKFRYEVGRSDKRVEKVYYDTDLKASEAIFYLHQKKLPISKISNVLSLGLVGKENQRKLVPTRWSITATDSIISKNLIEEIKGYQTVDKYLVFENYALGNKWVILFIPEFWSYEMIEAWFPGNYWNLSSKAMIYSDYERYWGKSKYAEIAGAYYSVRLSVTEKLKEMKRQAKVIVFREIHKEYYLPVGVWQTRVYTKKALDKEPKVFEDLNSALAYVFSRLKIKKVYWIKNSVLLKETLLQKKISEFTV